MEGVGLRVSAWEDKGTEHHLIIEGAILPGVPYMHRRMRRGAGGAAALPNSGKTVGKILAKQVSTCQLAKMWTK